MLSTHFQKNCQKIRVLSILNLRLKIPRFSETTLILIYLYFYRDEFSTFCQLGLKNPRKNEEKVPATTFLTKYFFGIHGDKPLTFEEFSTFVKCFQREMLLVEFLEHSKGHDFIKSSQLIEIFLKYTSLLPNVIDYTLYKMGTSDKSS